VAVHLEGKLAGSQLSTGLDFKEGPDDLHLEASVKLSRVRPEPGLSNFATLEMTGELSHFKEGKVEASRSALPSVDGRLSRSCLKQPHRIRHMRVILVGLGKGRSGQACAARGFFLV
jgi:hypothetical protein